MDLHSRIIQILNDERLADDDADEEQLVAEYGSDYTAEAVYLLKDTFGWESVFREMVDILLDDEKCKFWETAQIVFFYAAGDHSHKNCDCPMPADFTIALLYHRFPDGIDDGDRIWAIVCDLKQQKHWSDYDPMKDPGALREYEKLRNNRHEP